MDDWTSLRKKAYDEDAAWDAFRSWINRVRCPERQEAFLKAMLPLIGFVIRTRFAKLQSADRDDVCSVVSFELLKKVRRSRKKFKETGDASAFTAYSVTTIRRLVIDYFRRYSKTPDEFPVEMFYRRPQLSVSKSVDLKMILAELPDRITAFALQRDRFAFGEVPIKAVAKLLVIGKDIPADMLRNWFGVENPERCIAFVTLIARWYLHKYRDKFSPVLDGELAEYVASVDQQCHVI